MADTEALTFEKVWAMFQETREQMKETDRQMKETDRRMQETDRQIKETGLQMKETDRRMKETDRQIGKLGNRFGEMVEHLVVPNIMEKFNDLGFTFEQVAQNFVIKDSSSRRVMELDILLENGDTVMAVEVKSKPVPKDVDEHVSRMEVLRRRADARHDSRKIRGAIAAAVMDKPVRNYAHKAGFYTIEQTGDTVKINVPKGFIPGEW